MTPETHQKDDDKTLHQTDSRFSQAVLDALSASVAVLSSDGVIVAVNLSWQQFAIQNGDPEQRMSGVGVNYLDVINRASGPYSHEASAAFVGIRAVLDGTAQTFSLEYPCHSPDERRWFQMQVTPLQRSVPRMAVVLHLDITERKQLEERLALASEGRLHAVFENMAEGVIISTIDGHLRYWNPAALNMHGFSRSDELESQLSNFIDLFELSTFDGSIVNFEEWPLSRLLRNEPIRNFEVSVRRLDKEWRRLLSYGGSIVLDTSGRKVAFLTVIDITEKHRTNEELQRLAAIVQSSDDAIVGMSLNGVIQSWNPAAEQKYGYSASEAIGKPFSMLVLDEHVGLLVDGLARIARGEHTEPYETVRVRKDGKKIDVAARFSPIWGSNGLVIGVSAISRDISERKKLEEQLRQSQKMEAFGQLAGGVAHDFNNLLTIINGFSDLVARTLPSDDPNRKMLQEVTKAGERAASLTRQLLAFSRKQVLAPRVLDLNAVVTDIEKMLQRLIGEDMVMTTVLAPALWQVNVDPGQIEQIIMNLAVNARDAMPTGGNLTIETTNVDLDDTAALARPEVRPGRYIMLSVSDTGCGMTPEIQAHIFEPFFTTKEPGKGTGLGLATVYGIVKQSGGYIYLYSEPGHGTTFKIFIPAVEQRGSTGKSPHGVKHTPHGTETILLVEDEDAVRSVSRFALQSFGYTVLEAKRPTEAIRLCEQHPGSIALLVTDIVMPGMGGRQLAERIGELRPGIKVLYVSGYTDDAVVRHGILQSEVAFLQKPFTPNSLANKVREVLDQ